jgi:hypothetical protein
VAPYVKKPGDDRDRQPGDGDLGRAEIYSIT